MLGQKLSDVDEARYIKVIKALDKIKNVVEKIDEMTNCKIELEQYSEDIDMFKL